MSRFTKLFIFFFVVGLTTSFAQAQKPAIQYSAGMVTEMPGSMASFYMALAAVDAWECWRTKDPTLCQAFLERLKDPAGHVGFALFMVASRSTTGLTLKGVTKTQSRALQKLGLSSAKYLGLAAGFFVNDVFLEFYNHPLVQEYRAAGEITDPVERKRIRKEILEELEAQTLSNWDWWKDKLPDVASLCGAAYLTHKTIQALKAVKKIKKLKGVVTTTVKIIRAGSSITGIGFVMNVLGMAAEATVFLIWDKLLQYPIKDWWAKRKALSDLKEKESLFYEELSQKDFQKTKASAQALFDSWSRFRKTLLMDPLEFYSRHKSGASEFDDKIVKLLFFYTWLAEGGYESTSFWKQNNKEFHKDPHEDPEGLDHQIKKMSRSFFCGPQASESVYDSWTIAYIPVPGYSKPGLTPFRVVEDNYPNTCQIDDFQKYLQWRRENLSDCQQGPSLMRPGSTCQKFVTEEDYLHENRLKILRKNKFLEELNEAFQVIAEKAAPIQDGLAENYTRRLEEVMEWGLTADYSPSFEGFSTYNLKKSSNSEALQKLIEGYSGKTRTIPLSILQSFDEEYSFFSYWKSHLGTSPELEKIFEDLLKQLSVERQVAMDLYHFIEAGRDEFKSESLFIEVGTPTPQWSQNVRMWKDFLMDF